MAAIMTGRPRAVSELVPSVPARLEWLIARCLEKSPDRRWQSARDLALELGSLAEVSESPLPGRDRRPPTESDRGGPRRRGGDARRARYRSSLAVRSERPHRCCGAGALDHDRVGLRDASEHGRFRTDSGWSHLRVCEGRGRRAAMVPARSRLAPDATPGDDARPGLGRRSPPTAGRSRSSMPAEPCGRCRSREASRVPLSPRTCTSSGAWSEDGYIYYWGDSSLAKSRDTWRVRVGGGEPEPVGPGFPTDVLPGGRTLLTTVVAKRALTSGEP